MARAISLLVALLAVPLFGGGLPEWYSRELPDAEIRARLVREAAEIDQVTGDSLGAEIVLVELRVRPLYGSRVEFERGDFLLRARNNNDTSPAVSPDRVAGAAVLDLATKRTASSGTVFADNPNAPIWGGVPGTGQRPRRLGMPPNMAGGGTASEEERSVEQRDDRGDGEATVVDRLRDIELPLVTEDEPVGGYLYFEIPAKTKRKHLELSYDGTLGEFLIEFKRPD